MINYIVTIGLQSIIVHESTYHFSKKKKKIIIELIDFLEGNMFGWPG